MVPKMLKILKERKNMDKKAKKMLGDLILSIFQSIFVKN